ncbi:MAG: DNA-3-methyladenine glycosylase [Actinobacteria bacterium]|nr:DNA-3-methyladenine glycosylase [Actinomycetota bacterium]MCL5735584.1 DNA-3-methyladenine glycosylase [Actinomycetota bacterium]
MRLNVREPSSTLATRPVPELPAQPLAGPLELPLAELPVEFFVRPSDAVARDLIGKILWRTGIGGGRLTEVEAYLPKGDPASHSFRGRTKRNASMFGPAGHIYVYLSYGVHVLLNIVCDGESIGSAVLIRSFEPLGETSVLCQNRSLPVDLSRGHGTLKRVACGPGRVGQALGLHLGLDGLPLGPASGVRILDDGSRPALACGTRIGISRGENMPLRYFAADSPYVT